MEFTNACLGGKRLRTPDPAARQGRKGEGGDSTTSQPEGHLFCFDERRKIPKQAGSRKGERWEGKGVEPCMCLFKRQPCRGRQIPPRTSKQPATVRERGISHMSDIQEVTCPMSPRREQKRNRDTRPPVPNEAARACSRVHVQPLQAPLP